MQFYLNFEFYFEIKIFLFWQKLINCSNLEHNKRLVRSTDNTARCMTNIMQQFIINFITVIAVSSDIHWIIANSLVQSKLEQTENGSI